MPSKKKPNRLIGRSVTLSKEGNATVEQWKRFDQPTTDSPLGKLYGARGEVVDVDKADGTTYLQILVLEGPHTGEVVSLSLSYAVVGVDLTDEGKALREAATMIYAMRSAHMVGATAQQVTPLIAEAYRDAALLLGLIKSESQK